MNSARCFDLLHFGHRLSRFISPASHWAGSFPFVADIIVANEASWHLSFYLLAQVLQHRACRQDVDNRPTN
jgi:hypothetical protein